MNSHIGPVFLRSSCVSSEPLNAFSSMARTTFSNCSPVAPPETKGPRRHCSVEAGMKLWTRFTGWEAGQGRAEINAGEREMRETKSEGEHEVCRLRDWQSALICPPQGSSCCCCCLTVCWTILSEYPTGQRVQRSVYCTWYDLFYVITTFIWNSAVLSFQYFCCPVCQLLFPAAGCFGPEMSPVSVTRVQLESMN